MRESKAKVAKLHLMFQNLYNKTHKEKVDSATQTEQLDHYAIFSMMLKEIIRVTPELRSVVLPQAKFMDLYWQYFDLAEKLKKYMCEMPKLREKNQDKILGDMDYFERNHEPAEYETAQERNISADFNDLGVRTNLKDALKAI